MEKLERSKPILYIKESSDGVGCVSIRKSIIYTEKGMTRHGALTE